MVPASSLRATPSRYGCYRGDAVVRAVGDALTSTVAIEAGQPIATFFGTVITAEQAQAMIDDSQGRYLIEVGDNAVMDCRLTATVRPPLCYASIANQAQGLLLHGRILTVNHNNAFAEQAADGTESVTLYAVVHIPADQQEIMWTYGDNFESGFEPRDSSIASGSSDDEEEERNTSVSLSSDPERPAQPIGGAQRHLLLIARLEEVYADAEDYDACSPLAFRNEDYDEEDEA